MNETRSETENESTILQSESVEDLLRINSSEADTDTFELAPEDAKASVEAILFAAGDPISLDRIASVLGYDKEKTKKILLEMMEESLFNTKSGLIVRRMEDEFTLSTKPATDAVLRRLFLPRNRPPMTQAAYETLSIIAYNQPVTRSQVEAVRGVGSDSIIARLLEKNLIQECGTLDAPGRPTLFETSELFLKEFGLSSVRELPPMDMMMYGTLRDMETSLANASGERQDNQITIDQIAEIILPKAVLPESAQSDPQVDAKEIITISNAFFGEPKD
jgi:segregation and condensation protein B